MITLIAVIVGTWALLGLTAIACCVARKPEAPVRDDAA